MKKDISTYLYIIIFITILSCSMVCSQNNFFKYSTFYATMNMQSSMIEEQNYIAISKGYEETTQV